MGEAINTTIHSTLAKNILFLRKSKGMTQAVLAETAGVNETHIGNIENGRNSPSIEILCRIAAALEVSLRDLLTNLSTKAENYAAENTLQKTPLERINELLPAVREYQNLASEFGINDVFQDNGGKILQTLIITGLTGLTSREGNDAEDSQGNQYELKTVNQNLTSSFSTHHHINPIIIRKYRLVNWIFCIYEGIEIVEMYEVTPQDLEVYFAAWEEKWLKSVNEQGLGRDINNPKIPIKYVRKVGRLIYKGEPDGKLSLGPISRHKML